MLARPSYILPSQRDPSDPTFPAQSRQWTDQTRCELQETIARTRKTLADSRTLIREIDRALAWK